MSEGHDPDLRLAATWVIDAGGTLVVDDLGREAHWLRGVEAAVWSWLTAGRSRTETRRFLAASLDIEEAEATARLDAILDGWLRAGLLRAGSGGHG